MCLVLIKMYVVFQFPHIGLTQKTPESITSAALKEPHIPHLIRQVEEKLPPIYKVREKVNLQHRATGERSMVPKEGGTIGSWGQIILCKELLIYDPQAPKCWGPL